MQDLIEFIAKKLVEHPDDVKVCLVEGDEGDESEAYELRVHEEDMGRVIGKSGRTAKAIRTLLSSASAKRNVRSTLHIVE